MLRKDTINKIYLSTKHLIRNNLPGIMKLYKLRKRAKEKFYGYGRHLLSRSAGPAFSGIDESRRYYFKKAVSLYNSLQRPDHYDKPWIPNTSSYRGVKGVIKVGQIEITNACNLDCRVCRTKSAKRKPYIMPLDRFRHYVQEAKKAGTYLIDLHCVGETFMHPEIEGIFKICEKYGMEIYKVSTNGQLIDKYIDILFKYNHLYQSLRFSIDGGTREVYEKVRRGGSFDQLIANLERIRSLKQKTNKKIKVKVNAVICSDTLADIPNCFRAYSKYVDHPDDISFSLYEDVMLSDEDHNRENELFLKMPKIPFCKQPWEWLNVLSDGSVSYCCHEFNWDTVVGDVNRQSFREIWNGAEINRHRQMHLSRNFPEGIFCKYCLDTTQFSKQLTEIYIHYLLAFAPDTGEGRYQKDIVSFLEDITRHRGTDREYILKKYFC